MGVMHVMFAMKVAFQIRENAFESKVGKFEKVEHFRHPKTRIRRHALEANRQTRILKAKKPILEEGKIRWMRWTKC